MVRIAQVCARYSPYIGGVETHVKEVSTRLVSKGYDVEILTTDPTNSLYQEEKIKNIAIRRFKSWAPNEAYYFSLDLKRYLVKNSSTYDIIHAHGYNSFPALFVMQTKTNNAFVFTPHYIGGGKTFVRNLLHIPYNFLGKNIFKRADKVVCVSEFERKIVSKKFNVEENKIDVIPNGVNLHDLSRLSWNPNFSQPKITFSGRLEKRQKNIDKLIYSFRVLLDKYKVDAVFLVIGEGPYEKAMKRLIEKLDIQDRLMLRSWMPRDEYLKEIATSNVYVVPSEFECYCVGAAEAIMLGVPTVVANSSALSEYVDRGLAFGISMPITPDGIAAAIFKALNTNPNKPLITNDKIVSWDKVTAMLIEKVYETLPYHF